MGKNVSVVSDESDLLDDAFHHIDIGVNETQLLHVRHLLLHELLQFRLVIGQAFRLEFRLTKLVADFVLHLLQLRTKEMGDLILSR